jgi:hypothetical protein
VPAAGEEAPVVAVAASPLPTPVVRIAASRLAVPLIGGLAMAAALVALEITKRPRRRVGADEAIEMELPS